MSENEDQKLLRDTADELSRLRRANELALGRLLARLNFRLRQIEKTNREAQSPHAGGQK